MNIRFEYLYRDAGNFKQRGEVIFSNPDNISVSDITEIVENILIDSAFFSADVADVPDLHFPKYIQHLDHGWHEFSSFQDTDEETTDMRNRNIGEFIESLRSASKI